MLPKPTAEPKVAIKTPTPVANRSGLTFTADLLASLTALSILTSPKMSYKKTPRRIFPGSLIYLSRVPKFRND